MRSFRKTLKGDEVWAKGSASENTRLLERKEVSVTHKRSSSRVGRKTRRQTGF